MKRIKKKNRNMLGSILEYFKIHIFSTVMASEVIIGIVICLTNGNSYTVIATLVFFVLFIIFMIYEKACYTTEEAPQPQVNTTCVEPYIPPKPTSYEKTYNNVTQEQIKIYEKCMTMLHNRVDKVLGGFTLETGSEESLIRAISKNKEKVVINFKATYYMRPVYGKITFYNGYPTAIEFDNDNEFNINIKLYEAPKNIKIPKDEVHGIVTEAKDEPKERKPYGPKEDKKAPKKNNTNKDKNSDKQSDKKENEKKPEPKKSNDDNTEIGPDGKKRVKPNYAMIAKDWVSTNYRLLNKVCGDAEKKAGTGKAYSAIIPAKYLPEYEQCWEYIGKTMVDNDDIDRYEVVDGGLKVTVL